MLNVQETVTRSGNWNSDYTYFLIHIYLADSQRTTKEAKRRPETAETVFRGFLWPLDRFLLLQRVL